MLCVAAADAVAGTSLWSTFTQKAGLVGAVVMRPASEETAAALLREATSGFSCTTRAAQRFPKLAGHASRQNVAHNPAAEMVTVGEFAVAETGSIALNEPAIDRGR